MSRKYNFIYRQLVSDDADVAGAIAYSLYKKEKQAFIESFKKNNCGKDPEEDDIAKFHEIVSTPTNIERLRMQAVGLLGEFMDEALSDAISEIEDDCNKSHIDMIRKVIEPERVSVGRQYVRGIVQSVIGAVAFAILVAVVLFVVSLSKTQYSFTIGGKGDISMETVKCDTVPPADTLQIR